MMIMQNFWILGKEDFLDGYLVLDLCFCYKVYLAKRKSPFFKREMETIDRSFDYYTKFQQCKTGSNHCTVLLAWS